MLMYAMMMPGSKPTDSVLTSGPEAAASESSALPAATQTPVQAASDKSFTGIAAALPDDGTLILASDMFDAGTAELFCVDPATLGYRISLYTTAEGQWKDAFTGTLTGPVSGDPSAYYLKRDNFTVLSSCPLVIEDRLAKAVYCFREDFSCVEKIDISAWNACSLVFSKTDDSLFYETASGYALFRYSVDTKTAACVFTPNTDYDSVLLESILEKTGIAVFSGIRSLDKAFVDILVDLKSGTVLC